MSANLGFLLGVNNCVDRGLNDVHCIAAIFIILLLSGESNVDEATEAKLSRAEREIEQLKVDCEIAIEKKEKQVNLNSYSSLYAFIPLLYLYIYLDIAAEDIISKIQTSKQ